MKYRNAPRRERQSSRFDYIESGSLLGVNYKTVKSYPIGYEEIYTMYPLDFEEFAIANGLRSDTIIYLKSVMKTLFLLRNPFINRC